MRRRKIRPTADGPPALYANTDTATVNAQCPTIDPAHPSSRSRRPRFRNTEPNAAADSTSCARTRFTGRSITDPLALLNPCQEDAWCQRRLVLKSPRRHESEERNMDEERKDENEVEGHAFDATREAARDAARNPEKDDEDHHHGDRRNARRHLAVRPATSDDSCCGMS